MNERISFVFVSSDKEFLKKFPIVARNIGGENSVFLEVSDPLVPNRRKSELLLKAPSLERGFVRKTRF